MSIVVPMNGFGGGGNSLNFKVVGGTTAPTNPKENTIWVNTHVGITSWHFSAEEPNVYNLALHRESDWHTVAAPHKLSAGEILNFTIPKSVPHTFEALAITDHTGKIYYVRYGGGTAPTSWEEGTRMGVVISDDKNPIGPYIGDGTAYVVQIGIYHHQEGTVWISTGTSSPAAFNALKKNGITVYPISAKLFSGGMWWDAEAKSYQNGAWVDWWNGELYDSGNEYTNITGGWLLTSNGNYNLDTDAKKENDSFYFEVSASTSTLFITQSSIDVSNHKTLKFNCFNGSSNATDIRAGLISTNSSSNFYDNMDVYGGLVADGTASVDIESVSGKFYVCIAEWSKSGTYKVNISKIWLE